jgi:hypothetical protein
MEAEAPPPDSRVAWFPFAFCVVLGLLMGCWQAQAQQPAPKTAATLAQDAAKRFPQPVRVGDLLGRTVLQPLESQPVLGRVHAVIRQADGSLDVVVDYGGLFGFFRRPIAVPLDAMALLGQYMEITGFTPDELSRFATFADPQSTPLPPDSTIRVALAKPPH